MNARIHVPLRVAAVSAASLLVAMMAAAPASAADGDVQVVNTETVQVYTDATGKVQTKRVYEQIEATGKGTVDLVNPIETDGLRNLDGFGGFEVKDGEQVAEMAVDGKQRLRTVSNFSGDLPLELSVEYTLDGKRVDPEDVVGKTGKLEVKYVAKNITSQPQEVTYDDGKGGTVTETVDVPIPLVGSLTVTAPSSFTNVQSDQANKAGDGKGGTKLSFTITLFPPIGSDTAEFGYTAEISDGVVPRTSVTVLPVNPLEVPSFKSAADSYEGGADTGIELTAGASEIDANLLKLRDGAGELLAGLIQLRNGAMELEGGLAGVAAPGADKLASGASELSGGIGRLDDGARQLSDGASTASAGAGKLAAGAGQLSGGVGEVGVGSRKLNVGATKLAAGQAGLVDGLTTLYMSVDALPQSVRQQLKTNVDYQTLLGALQSVADGVGTRTDAPTAGTLLGGVNAIQYAMRFPGPNDCAVALTGGTPSSCGAMDAVELVAGQLNTGANDLDGLKAVLGMLNAVNGPADTPCPDYPDYAIPPYPPTNACEAVATIYYGLFGEAPMPAGAQAKVRAAASALVTVYQGVDSDLLGAGAGLDRLRAGLSNGDPAACAAAKQTSTPTDDCGIKQAAQAVQAGVPQLVDALTENISNQILAGLGKPTKGCDPESTLRCAAAALADGGSELSVGMGSLVEGVAKLKAGGQALASGAGDLSTGLTQLDDGAGQLADGTGKAADGANQVADGANQLADGLGEAASGSSQLADGLKKAAGSAPKLEDGAQRLSDEGTSKLVEAGQATAQNYGQMHAVILAGAERADNEKMQYGAPEGAIGLAAYSYEIKGEDGEGGRNVARGLGGLAVLAAGAGALLFRRRII